MKKSRNRDENEKNILKEHAFFVNFMERKGLADCIRYFPQSTTLSDLKTITKQDLLTKYNVTNEKSRENIAKVLREPFKEEQSDNSDVSFLVNFI